MQTWEWLKGVNRSKNVWTAVKQKKKDFFIAHFLIAIDFPISVPIIERLWGPMGHFRLYQDPLRRVLYKEMK